MYNTR